MKLTDRPFNQSEINIVQSIDWSTRTNQPTNQPINQPTNQPTNQSSNPSVSPLTFADSLSTAGVTWPSVNSTKMFPLLSPFKALSAMVLWTATARLYTDIHKHTNIHKHIVTVINIVSCRLVSPPPPPPQPLRLFDLTDAV